MTYAQTRMAQVVRILSLLVFTLCIIMSNAKAPLHFLALGDSLTEGFLDHGAHFHPYSINLKRLFEKDSFRNITITTAGVSGETTSQIKSRLTQMFTSHIHYDFVCILSGTNDLSRHGSNPEAIFGNIKSMYGMIWNDNSNHDTHLLCVTIPETSYKFMNSVSKVVNTHIRELCSRDSSKTTLVDLERYIPHNNETVHNMNLWSDNIHFSQRGYDKFAEIIYRAMKDKRLI